MRQAVHRIAAILLAITAAAHAQTATAPDVPGGDATLRGRLVHDTRPAAAGGIEVILYALDANGDPGLRRAITAPDGSFAFERVSNEPSVMYLVGTRLAGVPFGTRLAFGEGERERAVEIALSDPSTDPRDVSAGEARLRLERGCTHLRVHHSRALHNASERVVYVPPELREGARALFEIDLPEGASEVETPLGAGSESFDREGRRLRFWGPLYPGDQEIEFGYGVPFAPEVVLGFGFPRGSKPVSLFTPLRGVTVTGEGLTAEGEQPLPTGIHAIRRSDAFAPGGVLALRVALAEAVGAQAVRVTESRLWLDLDDAALDVSEQHEIEVQGDASLTANADAPLLCIVLPEGAENIRFSNTSTELGLSLDPSGALALRGPLPPGASSLALRYRLPVTSEPYTLDRDFTTPVELLTVLVADTGVVPVTDRLHRRRPVRTDDRSYLHLEAFGIAPAERVSITFERIPPRRELSSLAFGGLIFMGALGSIFFLAAPLRRGAGAAEPPLATEPTMARESIYRAIEALDEDFETGKLSQSDHGRMRSELRAKAVGLLQKERETADPTPSATQPSGAKFCTQCGALRRPLDRFCAQCGNALAETPGSESAVP